MIERSHFGVNGQREAVHDRVDSLRAAFQDSEIEVILFFLLCVLLCVHVHFVTPFKDVNWQLTMSLHLLLGNIVTIQFFSSAGNKSLRNSAIRITIFFEKECLIFTQRPDGISTPWIGSKERKPFRQFSQVRGGLKENISVTLLKLCMPRGGASVFSQTRYRLD